MLHRIHLAFVIVSGSMLAWWLNEKWLELQSLKQRLAIQGGASGATPLVVAENMRNSDNDSRHRLPPIKDKLSDLGPVDLLRELSLPFEMKSEAPPQPELDLANYAESVLSYIASTDHIIGFESNSGGSLQNGVPAHKWAESVQNAVRYKTILAKSKKELAIRITTGEPYGRPMCIQCEGCPPTYLIDHLKIVHAETRELWGEDKKFQEKLKRLGLESWGNPYRMYRKR